MPVELIADTERFHLLRQEWNELLEQSAADCLFLTWEWLYTWWKHFAAGRKLCLLAVREGGDLIGLAPLAFRPWRVTRFHLFPALEFMGAGNVGSDYLDIISRRNREQDVAEALADYLSRRRIVLELAQVNGNLTLAKAVAARMTGRDWTSAAIQTDVCPFIRLDGYSWDSYLATLDPEHRYNVRQRLRNLARRFDVRFERAETDAQRHDALVELVALHHKRWEGRGSSTAFCSPAHLAFHEDVSRLALERRWLRLFLLRLDGTPASAIYGFRYRGRFYSYQSGFEPEYGKYSVGLVTNALTIKSAIDEGAGEVDFLHGAERWKFHLAKDVRELHRLELYPPGLRGRLSRRAVETDRVARRLARRVLPQMVVQALVKER
jgi:CelD/BcsL family acetyltransferase involved in cellulose biosynthesis